MEHLPRVAARSWKVCSYRVESFGASERAICMISSLGSRMILIGYGDVFSGDRRGDWDAPQANFGVGWLTNHPRCHICCLLATEVFFR